MEYIAAIGFGVFLLHALVFMIGLILYESNHSYSRREQNDLCRLGSGIMKYSSLSFGIIVATVIVVVAVNFITWGITRGEF